MSELTKEFFVQVLDDRFGRLENEMSGMKSDIAELKEDVAVLKEEVAVLKEDVSGLKKDMSSLTERVSRLETGMTRLEDKVSDLKADVQIIKINQESYVERLINELHAVYKTEFNKYETHNNNVNDLMEHSKVVDDVIEDHSERIETLEIKVG